jgi:hypothetical protein
LNWFSVADVGLAVAELSRVSRKYVIVGVRTYAENQQGLQRVLASIERLGRRLFSHKAKTTVHRKADIMAALKVAQLRILKTQRIRFGPRETSYDFFLLCKEECRWLAPTRRP